jgi:predicted amidohydrolase YtcJ
VVGRDLRSIPADAIDDAGSACTMVGGRVVVYTAA